MENKKFAIFAAIALVTFLAVAYISSKNNSVSDKDDTTGGTPTTSLNSDVITITTSTTSTPTTTPKKTLTTPKATTKKSTLASSQEYLKALEIYRKSGYYLQFYPCQATPGSLVVKKGSKVMLDNRDKETHVFGIMGSRYTVQPYSFAIATLNTLGNNYVTCDGGGSAVINVQP